MRETVSISGYPFEVKIGQILSKLKIFLCSLWKIQIKNRNIQQLFYSVENSNLYIRICIAKKKKFWYNHYVGVFYALNPKSRQIIRFFHSGFPAVSVFFTRMRGVSF